MTRRNRPPKNFDVPKLHFVDPAKHNHVLPKSTDPVEIAFRQKHPGLDRLRKQDIGLYMARRLVSLPTFNSKERTYVNNIIAMNLFNTSVFAFQEEQEAGMRNELKLPELADEVENDFWYESEEGMYHRISAQFDVAEKASINWMNAYILGKERQRITSAISFARSVGNTALRLATVGLTRDTKSTPYEMQKNAQSLSTQLLDQSREAYLLTGVDPSLKHMAVAPVEEVFPRAPSEKVTDALIQIRRDLTE